MKTLLKIKDGKLTPCTFEESSICLFNMPTEEEKKEIIETMNIDSYELESALDPDEVSRVDFNNKRVLIIWKQPRRGQNMEFDVTSMGFFLRQDKLTIISGEELGELFSQKEFRSMNSVKGFILRYFSYTIRRYLRHLKEIKQETRLLETEISASMENKAFLKMFDLGERLVYYLHSIETNGAVLTKLRDHIERFELSMRQITFLNEIILENKQCARQAQIYSTLLAGLMDARGNIINNNMNVLLKNLTLINVIFLPLTLVAGIGGMSEFSMMISQYNLDWRLGYPLLFIAMILLGLFTKYLVLRYRHR